MLIFASNLSEHIT